MKKVDLVDQAMTYQTLESHVWDKWLDYKCEQAGITNHDERWHDMLLSIPEVFTIDIRASRGVLIVNYVKDGGTVHEELPLAYFYHDEQDQPDLEMLWHDNYYDIPLSGVAKYNGQYVYFNVFDQAENGNTTFNIYSMSEEEIAYRFKRHRKFQKNVGYHCDHHPDIFKEFEPKTEISKIQKFYKNWISPRKFELGEKLGTFYWFQFKYWSRH